MSPYSRPKPLHAFDAQLAATEIVRRCERRVGELVKVGQAEGTIKTASDGGNPAFRNSSPAGDEKVSLRDFFPEGNKVRSDHYAMADASPKDFDTAIEDAKAEGNLSRANVARKVKGEPKPDVGRSEWHHKKRHIGSNRIVERLAVELDARARRMCSTRSNRPVGDREIGGW